jgi:hypothetical protein
VGEVANSFANSAAWAEVIDEVETPPDANDLADGFSCVGENRGLLSPLNFF